MDRSQIKDAIKKAQPGIVRYLEIMELFPKVDVANNRDFQRKFNAFYKVRQRSTIWYETYFLCLQQWKGLKPTFDCILDYLHASLNKYEPSFSSKLVATLDPEQPIWDKYILQHTQIKAPTYSSKDKVEKAKRVYQDIQNWYGQFLSSADGKFYVQVFNEMVNDHVKITNLKKVDFILWQTGRD